MMLFHHRPFLILPSFWNASKADAARAELVAIMRDLCYERGEGNDQRALGASRLARRYPATYPLVLEFEQEPVLRAMAAAHLRTQPTVAVDTLASITGPGAASGGGWHVDQHARGFKALMYLDDVGHGNGPFAMLLGYNNTAVTPDPGRLGRRYSDAAVAAAVANGARVHPLYGQRGTVIVFETSSIHRGTPCLHGERHALTNYYSNTPTLCRRAPSWTR